MKHRNLNIVTAMAITFFASTAFADKVIIYNGYPDRSGGYRDFHRRNFDRHDERRRGWKESRYRRHHPAHGSRFYRHPRRHWDRGYGHRPHHQYPRPVYGAHYHPGHRSDTPVLAGGLIGGMIGAELGRSDPAVLGGALLGASIGRDLAQRDHHRH